MNVISEADIQEYKTEYRYPRPVMKGSGLEGAFDKLAVDIPFVFQHQGKYFMVYTGFDGEGYQSALAVSNDLLKWKFYTMLLERKTQGNRWDRNGGAVTWMIKRSDDLRKPAELRKINGKYWMIYHSYPESGYEAGAAEIGMAWSEDDELKQWNFLDKPVFSWKDGEAWERGGLYKACIVENNGIWYLFYNAKNEGDSWKEQIGIATSTDLVTWIRSDANPVLKNDPDSWDCTFVSDPYVIRDKDRWLCYYYGLGQIDPQDGLYHAEEGLALSKDLISWTKYKRPILSHGKAGTPDEHHAHKPAIFYKEGMLYHFYCGTSEAQKHDQIELFGEIRTICVATSKPIEECTEDEEL